MFLFKDDFYATVKTIRGVRYTVVSFYGEDKDIFEKVGDLITDSFRTDEIDEIPNGFLLDSGIAIEGE